MLPLARGASIGAEVLIGSSPSGDVAVSRQKLRWRQLIARLALDRRAGRKQKPGPTDVRSRGPGAERRQPLGRPMAFPPSVTGFAEGEASKYSEDKYVGGKSLMGVGHYSGPCTPPNTTPHLALGCGALGTLRATEPRRNASAPQALH